MKDRHPYLPFLYSEYRRYEDSDRRVRTHVLAAFLGALTGVGLVVVMVR